MCRWFNAQIALNINKGQFKNYIKFKKKNEIVNQPIISSSSSGTSYSSSCNKTEKGSKQIVTRENQSFGVGNDNLPEWQLSSPLMIHVHVH